MKRQADAEAFLKAEEESKRQAEAEAARNAEEESKRQAEAEAIRKAAEQARRNAEAAAIRKAAHEAKLRAANEAERKAADQLELKRKGEESLRRAAAEARQKTDDFQRRAESETRLRAEQARLAQEENRRKTAEFHSERQLVTAAGQVLVSKAAPPPPQTTDLDRSFNELFETGPHLTPFRARVQNASGNIEILSPIVETSTPPFQRLMALPFSRSQPLVAKGAARYRSAPPEFRPSLPVLPPQLHHMIETAIIPSAFHTARIARRPMPNWLMTGLISFVMVLGGIGIVNYILPSKVPAQTSAAPAPAPTPTLAPEPAVTTSSSVVSKRLVELTGFRVRPDRSGKTSVQYVVINHSEKDMKGFTAHVVLRSASAKPFQAPIANFTVQLPPMAALESKDRTILVDTPVDRGVPDWTDLRAEVRIEQ